MTSTDTAIQSQYRIAYHMMTQLVHFLTSRDATCSNKHYTHEYNMINQRT